MTPLPRALLALAPDQPIPLARHGVLIPSGRIGETDIRGAIVMVETDSDIATLQMALAASASMIALRGYRTGADLQRLATLLCVAEAECGCPEGSTSILAMTDGLLPAPAARESLAEKSKRLAGLVWDQRALALTLGARRTRTEAGEWTPSFTSARAATLLTAAAARVPAYDSVFDLDDDALAQACRQSRAEGFFGQLTATETQTAVVEALYAG
ncbi:hypothetical protein MUO32_22635 [Shinella sp. CPCC 101442]|uniref:hypothetical protein n=1 Tax=Shinella sp. CPCC 101442 TaxID=2932265 RepID=UPI0021528F51|nr:hypothetical protein [Shinella sp. CPCC 101442]MCR6501836.1 hypothetical protein [Shinella sp. CPCC 101442]